MLAENYSKYYFQGVVISHNNQILQRGGGSGIERQHRVSIGDPEVNSVGQDNGLLPGSCPAVDSTGYEIEQRQEHQRQRDIVQQEVEGRKRDNQLNQTWQQKTTQRDMMPRRNSTLKVILRVVFANMVPTCQKS